jgi:hypothetical protein
MERRTEERKMADGFGHVRIEVLGETDETVLGRVMDVSGSGTRLECNRPIRAGSAVKIQWEDEMWLAEAIHTEECEGNWNVGLKVRQRLTRLAGLRKLMAGLVGSPTDGVSGSPLAGARF